MAYTTWEDIPDIQRRVARALGIDETEITMEELAYFENAPLAELTIKKKVPHWETLSEEQVPIFEACIVYQTAVFLIEKSIKNNYKVEQTSTLKVERFDVNYDILNALDERLSVLLGLLEYEEDEMVGHFTVTNREY